MTGILTMVPTIVSVLVAAFLPVSILPSAAETAFVEGGWGMRLILFAFLISVWLIIDRTIVVLRSSGDAYRLVDSLRSSLVSGNAVAAQQICLESSMPLARIISAGLGAASKGSTGVLHAMDEQAYAEIPVIEKRTGYLALMGNVATLMGLFGTIIGLIHSFGAVSMSSAQENATLLAAGISEAMNCTAFGLLTGILALFAFSVINGRTQTLIDDINLFSLRAYRMWKQAIRSESVASSHTAAAAISEPHAHLMESLGLLKAKGKREKRSTFASLQLTPLIDMFIVMVIFLLMSFSATGQIIQANRDIRLPFAEQVRELERVPVVAISYPPDDPAGGVVTLEGSEVSTARELMSEAGPDLKIAKLTERLQVLKNNWKVTNPNSEFKGQLIVQSDKNVHFKVIKRVMYSAAIAGYGNLMFAVQRRGEGNSAKAVAN